MVDEVVIVGVKKEKKNYKVTTTLDSYVFDEDTIIKYMILKDRVFTKTEFEEIMKTAQINSNFNKALRYLGYGARTAVEIKNYLKDEVYVEDVLDKLEKLGYINDETYATQFLDYVIRNRKGPLFFASKLKEKGVNEEVIQSVLRSYFYEDIKKNMEFVAIKFLSSHKNKPPKMIKNQLAQKLLRDGFAAEVVFSYVKGLEIEDNSSEHLKKEMERLFKKYNQKNLDANTIKQKVIQSLLQKGYEYSIIRKVVE